MAANTSLEPPVFTFGGVTFPIMGTNTETLKKIQEGDVPDFDVLVATFPKSGTQRILELTWLLTHKYDFDIAGKTNLHEERIFMPEFSPPDFSNALSLVPPKLGKSHLPASFLSKVLINKKPKVIVGMRNPKDILVSYFHFHRAIKSLHMTNLTWDEFFNMYCEGKTCFDDIFNHFLGWWQKRNEKDVLIVKFEDFAEKGVDNMIKTVARFLDVPEPSIESIKAIAKWIAFESMKDNPMTNLSSPDEKEYVNPDISPYLRKGSTGDWVNYFSPMQSAYIDRLYEERCVPKGLTFTFT